MTQYTLHVSRCDAASLEVSAVHDSGPWLDTHLAGGEAENERMHLLTAMELRRPGPLFKIAVIGTQGEPLKESAYEIP